MKYNFCTLFDSYYLTRGIALYKSLEKVCPEFHIYIIAFDENSYSALTNLNFKKATIIHHKDFENEKLLKVKSDRTVAEYFWTCTASVIWYTIKTYNLDNCTYLDADIYFYSSLNPIYEKIGNSSIAITPHNFSPDLKSSEMLGKYCVQFVYFKNDYEGIKALKWWRNSCIDWCYAKMEDDKYGDQKYLDQFEKKFMNVCIIDMINVGVAPWNCKNYHYKHNKSNILLSIPKKSIKDVPIIFYHYQGLKFNENDREILAIASPLYIPKILLSNLYSQYILTLIKISCELKGIDQYPPKKVLYKRYLHKILYTKVKSFAKKYILIQKMYYFLKKNRYNRPEDIGTSL